MDCVNYPVADSSIRAEFSRLGGNCKIRLLSVYKPAAYAGAATWQNEIASFWNTVGIRKGMAGDLAASELFAIPNNRLPQKKEWHTGVVCQKGEIRIERYQ